jgi:hypothetical protein
MIQSRTTLLQNHLILDDLALTGNMREIPLVIIDKSPGT